MKKRLVLILLLFAAAAVSPAAAQSIAILTPDRTEDSREAAAKLAASFGEEIRQIDPSLAEAAFSALLPANPFNLTALEAKRIGTAVGCDGYVIMRAATQRRSAFQRPDYFESYAVIYLISTRSGRLVSWQLKTFEDIDRNRSRSMLTASLEGLAADLSALLRMTIRKEISETMPAAIEEVPEAGSAAAKNFRAPIPYRRLKPEYTAQAAFYDVAATVEVLVDLDAAGNILRVEMARWAGFGLDESAVAAIRAMNWRPAERDGKPLPMRFLVRYNFKKIEKESADNKQ